MKVLIVTPGFPKDEQDTSCIPALQLLILGLKEYCDIQVVSLQYPNERGDYKWNEIMVHSLGGKNKKPIRKLVTKGKTFRRVRKVAQEYNPDIIHSFWINDCALIADKVSVDLNIPHISSAFGQDVRASNRWLRWVKKRSFPIICSSEYQAVELAKKTPISPGIKCDKIIHLGVEENIPSENKEIDILGVGNLTKLKNFRQFIEICARIAYGKSLNCVIVGDGPKKHKLEQMVANYGLSGKISFVGHKSREEVLKLMSTSKVFLHCSKFESFGLVMAEAQAAGCKIFSNMVGIAPEMEGREGLVNVHRKISDYLDADVDLKGERQFKIEDTVSKYYKEYQRILGQ